MLKFISYFDSLVFSSELKEVKFSSDSAVTMTFVVGGTEALSATYTPTAQGTVIVYALNEVFAASRVSAVSVCSIRLANAAGENAEVSFTCIQCSAIINASAAAYLEQFFLIGTCSNRKTTAPGRRERFWLYHTGNARTLVRTCKYIDDAGQITSSAYSYPETVPAGQLKEISFMADDFAVEGKTLFRIDWNDGIRYLTYEVDTRHDIDAMHFEYENIFGLMDDITYFGLRETELQAEMETGMLNGRLVNQKLKTYQTVKVHSGYLSSDEYMPYMAFVSSPQKMLFDENGGKTAVVITEQETKYDNDNSVMADFNITFRRDVDAMSVSLRARIFDSTFDNTFN